MRKRKYIFWIVATIVLGAIFIPILIRRGVRYNALRKVVGSPESRRRASIQPHKRVMDTPTSMNPINVGYATFDVGPSASFSIEARGSEGTCLLITHDQLKIL